MVPRSSCVWFGAGCDLDAIRRHISCTPTGVPRGPRRSVHLRDRTRARCRLGEQRREDQRIRSSIRQRRGDLVAREEAGQPDTRVRRRADNATQTGYRVRAKVRIVTETVNIGTLIDCSPDVHGHRPKIAGGVTQGSGRAEQMRSLYRIAHRRRDSDVRGVLPCMKEPRPAHLPG